MYIVTVVYGVAEKSFISLSRPFQISYEISTKMEANGSNQSQLVYQEIPFLVMRFS